MIEFKEGVPHNTLDYHMRPVLEVVDKVWESYGYKAVVTSTTDGQHSARSLHYCGLAVDIRIRDVDAKDLPDMVSDIIAALSSLNPYYQVITEADHVHIEWDPFESVHIGVRAEAPHTYTQVTVKAPTEFRPPWCTAQT